jgi:hypothetical protein
MPDDEIAIEEHVYLSRCEPQHAGEGFFSMWGDGAREADISAPARNQTEPTLEKASEGLTKLAVHRRRIARRLVQRARRKAFRQETSANAEG